MLLTAAPVLVYFFSLREYDEAAGKCSACSPGCNGRSCDEWYERSGVECAVEQEYHNCSCSGCACPGDTSPTYSTSGSVLADGGAIAFDFNDAVTGAPALPSTCSRTHCTILYRHGGYDASQLAQVDRAVRSWMAQRNRTNLSFQTYAWGAKSDYVFGDVLDLWKLLQSEFRNISDNDRPCHTELRC